MGIKDVLVISAHAADYCTRAGGTLAKLALEGYNLYVVCLTFGAHGESGGYWKNQPNGTVEECCEVRQRESTNASKVLGVKSIRFMNWADYPLTINDERQRVLTKMILEIRPEIVFTHWTNDPTNPDHQTVGRAVIMACNSASQLGAFPNVPAQYYPNIYFFESTVPFSEFNGFSPEFIIDIGETYQTKLAAIAKFECQPFLANYYIHFAQHRAFQARTWTKMDIKYAEGFKRFVPYVGKMLPLSERD